MRSEAIERAVKNGRIGPFRFVTALGEGGFAPVYLASEEYGGTELRTVALKLFAIDELSRTTASMDGASRTARDRIIEEARALCRVEHPNIVRFLQIVDDPDGGVLALAMEHVRGRSLASRLDDEGPLPVEAALSVGAAVASALAAVHAAGLVHRDVKPDNVIETGGVLKLIDFGIAASARPATAPKRPALRPVSIEPKDGTAPSVQYAPVVVHSEATDRSVHTDVDGKTVDAASDEASERHVAGTMGYIDPVCLGRDQPADASSDLYSLGALLYECLTGQLPSSQGGGESTMRLRLDIALGKKAPPGVRTLAPHVPEAFATLVDSLLAPERELRPRRAEAVATELERLRRVAGARSRELPPEGPFRGLLPFDARHRDVYFGRSVEIASSLEMLRTRGLVALVGPSGSGKSSLARAGVLPALEAGELGAWPKKWQAFALSPGRMPKTALAVTFGGERLPDDPGAMADTLAAKVEATGVGLVLLVDALEELATVSDRSEGAYVSAFLAAVAAHPVPGLRVVVTARRDLLDPLLASPTLGPALARGMQLVAPLSASTWLDATVERVAAYGYTLAPGMRDDLASQLGTSAAAMPLVEFALARLWDARDELRRELPREALAGMGGLAGALAGHAEATVAQLVTRHGVRAAEVAEQLLVALTTPHGTRASRSREELADAVPDALRDDALAALEHARLVVVSDGAATLAHDALVSSWPRLRGAVESRRRDREIAAEVEAAAARWQAMPGRDRLLRGRTLRDAQSVATAQTVKLGATAEDFVKASRRAELRGQGAVLGLVGSLFVAAAVLAWAVHEEETIAEKREKTAEHVVATIKNTQDQGAQAVAAEMQRLVVANHSCERELARCTGDAGAR